MSVVRLTPGDVAPAFALRDQHGETIASDDLRGRKTLIYFYPEAGTPGCTTQAQVLRDASAELDALGVGIVGVSPDQPETQRSFAEAHALPFPLLSDPSLEVIGGYGAVARDGRSVLRSALLLDEDGAVLEAWYGVRPQDTALRAALAI